MLPHEKALLFSPICLFLNFPCFLLRTIPIGICLNPFDHTSSFRNMDDYLNLFIEETSFYNRVVLGTFLPESWWGPLPHWFQGWLRNYIGGVLLYFISGFLWCFYIYRLKRNVYIPKGQIFFFFFLFWSLMKLLLTLSWIKVVEIN